MQPLAKIVEQCHYPHTLSEIEQALQDLLSRPVLTCDIETSSLKIATTHIVTIAFAWSEHEGIAFCVQRDQPIQTIQTIKDLLAQFFDKYEGKVVYHNASFDGSILVRTLFPDQLTGLHTICKNIHDTKLIMYLHTNTTVTPNSLKLKDLTRDFAGDYAVDVTDTSKIPTPELLRYNLTDALATIYLFNKYYPILGHIGQNQFYEEIFRPSIKNIIHMQLTGLPQDIAQVQITKTKLEAIQNTYLDVLTQSELVKAYEWELQRAAFIKKNQALKTKVKPIEDFKASFNPGSPTQKAGLLYDHLELPMHNMTLKGNPSTDADTLKELYQSLINTYNITEEEL